MVRDQLTEAQIEEVIQQTVAKLRAKIARRGTVAFVGPHEAFGVMYEEVCEAQVEMQKNDRTAFRDEMLDVAVAAMWGAASIQEK